MLEHLQQNRNAWHFKNLNMLSLLSSLLLYLFYILYLSLLLYPLFFVYFFPTLIKNRVGDDGVPAILQYRPSDLYPTDKKETVAILQKYTHTPLQICK